MNGIKPSQQGCMTIKQQLIDAACWTPFAPLIRKYRVSIVMRTTNEKRDIRKISVLLTTIMAAHSDLLS
jgi:hypothetical protein